MQPDRLLREWLYRSEESRYRYATAALYYIHVGTGGGQRAAEDGAFRLAPGTSVRKYPRPRALYPPLLPLPEILACGTQIPRTAYRHPTMCLCTAYLLRRAL